MPRPNKLQSGRADVRLAVVSPFVDRRHGTERALAELLERLARDHHCEVHLYAQRVADLAVSPPQRLPANGSIVWHRIPAISGPQLVQFLFWCFLNSLSRHGIDSYRDCSVIPSCLPGSIASMPMSFLFTSCSIGLTNCGKNPLRADCAESIGVSITA